MNDPVLPTLRKGTYRHNKSGKLYEVIGVVLQTETDEALVVYRPLYKHDHGYELFARPYEMFIEVVEIDGKKQPRFNYIDG